MYILYTLYTHVHTVHIVCTCKRIVAFDSMICQYCQRRACTLDSPIYSQLNPLFLQIQKVQGSPEVH